MYVLLCLQEIFQVKLTVQLLFLINRPKIIPPLLWPNVEFVHGT